MRRRPNLRRPICSHPFSLLLTLSLLHPQLTLSQPQPCNPLDLTALLSLSTTLWPPNSSTCCVWPGVSCDPISLRVTSINLSNKGLKGTISPSLSSLSRLTTLNLSGNHLTGLLPPPLFHLLSLTVLDLSLNSLSGPLPANFTLPSIRICNISSNQLNGTLPPFTAAANLTILDASVNLFTGKVDSTICLAAPKLQILRLSMNLLSGTFPAGFGNCSKLTELSLCMNDISGSLPEDLFKMPALTQLYLQVNELTGSVSPSFSNLSKLNELDLSFNGFSGAIPNMFGSFGKLEMFAAQSNGLHGILPSSISNMSMLRVLNLRNNSLVGTIDLNFTAMGRLGSLDLGSNGFTGLIPDHLSRCVELKTLNLAKNRLSGEIPDSFGSFASLSYLSLSLNTLSNISSALGILQRCANLSSLVLTRNFVGETMPQDGIQGFRNLEVLVIPNCRLSGSIPRWLANSASLEVLDLSWNRFDGAIPSWIGNFERLFYLDLSNNSLTGVIPDSFTRLKGLFSENSSQQTASMQDFPFYIKRNVTGKGLQYNQVSSFPPSLILSSNFLVGTIPGAFGNLRGLHMLDLSKNRLTGAIPAELSGMLSLESLDLSHNNLTGSIPSSLTKLTFLSYFNVAGNSLSGAVPKEGQFLTFSSTDFEGNLGLCGFNSSPCPTVVSMPSAIHRKKDKGVIVGMTFGFGLGTALVLSIVYLAVSRISKRQKNGAKEAAGADKILDSADSSLVLLFQNKDIEDLSIRDILKSTGNFDKANIVGCGGFGMVYKATLPDGKWVAIKRLSGDYGQMEREFHAEVEALSRAQHCNLVQLQGYCKIGSDRLLIYSYMENGSLDYWLHENFEGGYTLDWSTRLQIARGAARGLAYLHQLCEPHILHRDIKSSNILLDEKFEARLADFGLARLILPYDTHVTTDLVGTLGYIPPEYGQSSVATFKGDVYSFGVVLLELLTGRRPVDMCKPKESRELISWVLQMKKENREAEVFDPFIYDKAHESQLTQMLEIACLCSSLSPKRRPTTQELVSWLDNIGTEGLLIK